MAQKKFVVEIEKAKEAANGRPSMGPVYRNLLGKDGFRPLTPGIDSCWDIFRASVEKFPTNECSLVARLLMGRVRDVESHSANCMKWIISMQAFNAHGLYCVPLYDSLECSCFHAVCEFELNNKGLTGLKTFPNTIKYLKTLVSFGKVTDDEQKKVAENFGLALYSWDQFLQLVGNLL
ncbi:Long chain acyl-CoA synthetase 4 [Camellia lanceoleosa]|uniref:Long chain acyl-CoA synthetase 4 n=1 Tax=Camellia lanceoleosa TaxID=1840588 RepID=A0ACC0ILV8_9ERIC|nr:Long chain acyl-CoA synthetase 4 [Camellia lanceoleosa]